MDVKEKFNEIGVTNLGPIPKGISFYDAIIQLKEKRKYKINPYEGGHRLTLCDTLRAMWKLLDNMPETEDIIKMKEYISSCYDFGKRMDSRMKELKSIILEIDPNYKENK